jgi:hypothetical protein
MASKLEKHPPFGYFKNWKVLFMKEIIKRTMGFWVFLLSVGQIPHFKGNLKLPIKAYSIQIYNKQTDMD